MDRGRRIILMDVMMPDISVAEFTARAKQLGTEAEMIVISAANEIVAPVPRGAIDRLLKPINLDQLRSAIRRAAAEVAAKKAITARR
jgi:DNA-binding NtrC family response regulator